MSKLREKFMQQKSVVDDFERLKKEVERLDGRQEHIKHVYLMCCITTITVWFFLLCDCVQTKTITVMFN